ncbi:NFACT RNA binding domain-containing protein [Oscillibacter sp.]|uniref:Rqc2 family fibronectin-binding protein n=1 Tax=Oscillibacter sp. TaxID=1945593 RepID=UPI0028ACDA5B|nr:NFACT RNA binding domain-containing protein [Oscillibacter sp.]
MALDAVCLRAITEELREQLLGVRVDKVQQPAKDQVILLLRGGLRLLLTAGNNPRIQLTGRLRDNPAEPPMFCMLLRKHLVGARIAALTQPGLERLVELELDVTDDFGQPGKRTLVLEAMGRHSNIILLDGERRIMECLRRVDAEMSAQRPVLPGLFYQYPPAMEKTSLLEAEEDDFFSRLAAANPERRLDEFLLDGYFGISPLLARELAFRAAGETDSRLFSLDATAKRRFWEKIIVLQESVKEKQFTPFSVWRDGKPLEFSCIPIEQYGAGVESHTYPSFSDLLDDFYESRERQERIRQRGADLVRAATNARDRLRRKLAMQEKDYEATQNRDALRLSGELITANLYRLDKGQRKVTCENYYDEGREIEILLDPLLTPQENAAKYFKRYAKAKTAERYLKEQMEIARHDAAYLESVLEEIAEAETEQDFNDIRAELKDVGFLRQKGKEKRGPQRPAKPREFRTTAGLRVLVGRNNRQNDRLTHDADRRDIWFHTQKIHGSHVILRTDGAEPDRESVVEAAKIAAWYSQARESGNVPVDFTQVKNVKKPAGARPGMVIYTTCETVHVTPEEETVKRLSVK